MATVYRILAARHVFASSSLSAQRVSTLNAGEVVNVLEVSELGGRRWGRLEQPVVGWFVLAKLDGSAEPFVSSLGELETPGTYKMLSIRHIFNHYATSANPIGTLQEDATVRVVEVQMQGGRVWGRVSGADVDCVGACWICLRRLDSSEVVYAVRHDNVTFCRDSEGVFQSEELYLGKGVFYVVASPEHQVKLKKLGGRAKSELFHVVSSRWFEGAWFAQITQPAQGWVMLRQNARAPLLAKCIGSLGVHRIAEMRGIYQELSAQAERCGSLPVDARVAILELAVLEQQVWGRIEAPPGWIKVGTADGEQRFCVRERSLTDLTPSAPPPPNPPSTQPSTPPTAPSEEPALDEEQVAFVGGMICSICLDKHVNATFVHGDTGHTVCCLACAKLTKQDHGLCPVCREPIDLVIRNFTS